MCTDSLVIPASVSVLKHFILYSRPLMPQQLMLPREGAEVR